MQAPAAGVCNQKHGLLQNCQPSPIFCKDPADTRMDNAMSTSQPTDIQNEALWEFPMHYPLHIMGEAQHPLHHIIGEILSRHVPEFKHDHMNQRASSGGKYISINVTVYVTCKEQINGMYADFAACKQIRLVL
jgi:putative lipoic acid-binding regulatory protein